VGSIFQWNLKNKKKKNKNENNGNGFNINFWYGQLKIFSKLEKITMI